MPNPVNEQATIRFSLPEAASVELVVYDVMGRVVRHLVDRQLSMGHKLVPVDVSNLPSGTYFYRLHAGDFVRTRRLTVVR